MYPQAALIIMYCPYLHFKFYIGFICSVEIRKLTSSQAFPQDDELGINLLEPKQNLSRQRFTVFQDEYDTPSK